MLILFLAAMMHPFKLSGVAFLCFLEDDSKFQGILAATDNGLKYGIAGKIGELPSANFNECCFDGLPTFYDVTVADNSGFMMEEELVVKHVMRIGGDNCSLICDQLQFDTKELLVGQQAESYIAKYFPERFRNQNCYICIGDMTVNTEHEL